MNLRSPFLLWVSILSLVMMLKTVVVDGPGWRPVYYLLMSFVVWCIAWDKPFVR